MWMAPVYLVCWGGGIKELSEGNPHVWIEQVARIVYIIDSP
jgi:hypothetical protein